VCIKALPYSGKSSYKISKNLLATTKEASDTVSDASESSQTVKSHDITGEAPNTMKINNLSTIDELIEIHLTTISNALCIRIDNPSLKEVQFEDRFAMIVYVEYSDHKNCRLKMLILQAKFKQADSSIVAINYRS
jgi:hypothetical protein